MMRAPSQSVGDGSAVQVRSAAEAAQTQARNAAEAARDIARAERDAAQLRRDAAQLNREATSPGVVKIEKDGKVITLENPTPEQLSAITSGTRPRSGPIELSGGEAVTMLATVVVGVVTIVWLLLNHRRRRAQSPATNAQAEARMARIENAIDSVAVEVERISEGQRYTSRMLAEGAAVPVGVADRGESVLQNRGDVR